MLWLIVFFLHFSIFHSNVIHREICVKYFSGTIAPSILKFGTNAGYDLFSAIFNKNFISFFSGTERPTKLKLSPHMDSRLMYHVYLNRAAGSYLFLQFSFSQIPKHYFFCHSFL